MNLSQFLVKAKIATYATGGESSEKNLSDGGKELNFVEGHFHYRDKYYGFNPFSGQEVVWKDNKLLWSMTYYGKTVSNNVPENLYDFLKGALLNVEEEKPFRGPTKFSKEKFRYGVNVEGDITQFSGEETIH